MFLRNNLTKKNNKISIFQASMIKTQEILVCGWMKMNDENPVDVVQGFIKLIHFYLFVISVI